MPSYLWLVSQLLHVSGLYANGFFKLISEKRAKTPQVKEITFSLSYHPPLHEVTLVFELIQTLLSRQQSQACVVSIYLLTLHQRISRLAGVDKGHTAPLCRR